MEQKNVIIICITIIIVVAVCVGAYVLLNSQISTSLVGDSDSSFYSGDSFTVTLIDSDGNKLANKTVELSFNGSGEVQNVSVVTDSSGVGRVVLNLDSGEYTVVGTFSGDDSYKNSTFTQVITVTGLNLGVVSQALESTSTDESAASVSSSSGSYWRNQNFNLLD